MSILDTIKQTFRHGNSAVRLIYINAAVFVVLQLLTITFRLFNGYGDFMVSFLAMPADLTALLHRAWTPLTYMFLHEGFLHFFFNKSCFFI